VWAILASPFISVPESRFSKPIMCSSTIYGGGKEIAYSHGNK